MAQSTWTTNRLYNLILYDIDIFDWQPWQSSTGKRSTGFVDGLQDKLFVSFRLRRAI